MLSACPVPDTVPAEVQSSPSCSEADIQASFDSPAASHHRQLSSHGCTASRHMEMLRRSVTCLAHTVVCWWLRCGAASFHHFGERQRSVGQEELSDLSVPCLLVCALSSHPPCNLARAIPFVQKRTKVLLGLCVFTVGLFSFTALLLCFSLYGLIPILPFLLQLPKLISVSGPLHLQLICLELSSPMLA